MSKNTTELFSRVPRSGLSGLRSLNTVFNSNMFQEMPAAGLTYDNSMFEYYGWGRPSDFDKGMPWPYTLDFGTPQSYDER
jgi:hypothetical protein